MVGPSFGGFNVRVFTGRYPADVAGVVLVDPSHEDQQDRIDRIVPAAVRDQRKKDEKQEEKAEKAGSDPYTVESHLGIERLKAALRPETPQEFYVATDSEACTEEVTMAHYSNVGRICA